MRCIRFGDWILNMETRELRNARQPQPVALRRKVFELLVVLLQERPRVVAREALRDRLWPSVNVTDGTLGGLVNELRATLGERGRPGCLILNVHGVGYRFGGEATEVDPPVARSRFRLVGSEREFLLQGGINLVGRDDDAAVRLEALTVSRQHAHIVIEDDAAVLYDLGSTNGTFVSDTVVVEPLALTDGVRIRFGEVKLTYRSRQTASLATEALASETSGSQLL